MSEFLKNQYAISAILTSVTTFLLAVIVWGKNNKRKLNRIYLFWACSISFWAFSLFLSLYATDANTALVFSKLLHLWAIILPSVYVHFVLSFLKETEKFKKIINVSYGVALFLILCNFSPWFLNVSYQEAFDFYVTKPLMLYPIHMVVFAASVLFAILRLYVSFRKSSGLEKKQIGVFFFSSIIGYSGGLTNYLINYNISIFPLYPFGNYTICVYVLMMGFGILRYKLLDIHIIIRRTFVFAGSFISLWFMVALLTILFRDYLDQYINVTPRVSRGISILVAMFLFDPLRNWLTNFTDKFLFQKKYDYHKLLKDASRGMSNIESLEHLLGLVAHFITMKMRVKNVAALMLLHGTTDKYGLVYQRGFEKKQLSFSLDKNDALIRYLNEHREAIDKDIVKEDLESSFITTFDYNEIIGKMDELRAGCCIPSFLGKDLKSILFIGSKKSGEDFSSEDLSLLYTLAQESSIAIENARLYDEAVNRSQELQGINDRLEISKRDLAEALRKAEIANCQLKETQMQLVHEQKMATLGRLAASVGHEVNNPLTILSMNVSRVILKHRKSGDLKVADILEYLKNMEKSIERIKAVVNTLTGLLKKSEKGQFEPLSLKLILEETLPLVQYQTYLDNLSGTEVDLNVSGGVPLIRGNLERLQEVFLNLFINAYHAMEGRLNRKICVKATLDPQDANMISILFTDNGSGMSPEIAKKVFNYGFTTKASGKGSGLGLYMCKYIIELHGGSISVDTKLGEGTTFALKLPICTEESLLSQTSA